MVTIPHRQDTGYRYAICQLDKTSGQTGAFVYHPDRPNIAISKVYTRLQDLIDMLLSISCCGLAGDTRIYWENIHHD